MDDKILEWEIENRDAKIKRLESALRAIRDRLQRRYDSADFNRLSYRR